MSEISGILKIRPKKKGGEVHEIHYTNRNGKTAALDLKPNIRAYAGARDGDPVLVEMEGNAPVRAVVPGKEIAMQQTPPGQKKKQDGQDKRFGPDLPPPGTSPYNFTPYEPGRLARPSPEPRKWSGEIVCSLTALTPLLVSGRQEKTAEGATICAFMRVGGKPIIPGTSLKGMLRSLMETLSFSGMRPMNKGHLYWREVVGGKYRSFFPDLPLGGLLRKRGAEYSLTPTEVARKKKNDPGWIEMEVGDAPKRDNDRFYYFKKAPVTPKSLDMDAKIVGRLWEQLTPAQEKRWPQKKREAALAGEGLPVFYRKDAQGKIEELGFCRYFRIAYKYTPYELAWPEGKGGEAADFAEGIFGHARKEGSRAGRVSITACEMDGVEMPPQETVLGGPKPTCLGFYLVQDGKLKTTLDHKKYYRGSMKSYNEPFPQAALRGRKLYWHHDVPDKEWPKPPNANKKVTQILKPLGPGASGEFRIRVKNLTDSELGCLFEALELLPGCAHKLGMAKPLGFGSVRISVRRAAIRESGEKYASLAARLKPASGGGMERAERAALRDKFRAFILKEVGGTDYYGLEQIRDLYRMLNYENRPDWNDVRYMTLKQFGANLILPNPDFVLK